MATIEPVIGHMYIGLTILLLATARSQLRRGAAK